MSVWHITLALIVWKIINQAHTLSYLLFHNAVSWLIKLRDHLFGQSGSLFWILKTFFIRSDTVSTALWWWLRHFMAVLINNSAQMATKLVTWGLSHYLSHVQKQHRPEIHSLEIVLQPRFNLVTDIQRKTHLKQKAAPLQFNTTACGETWGETASINHTFPWV